MASSVPFWEQRFETDEYVFGTEPNDFLVSQSHRLEAGWRALAVGDGEGRNGVWLAGQSLEVVSVDGSANALAKARRLAKARGLAITTVQADLLDWHWPEGEFDVVACLYVHVPPAARPAMHQAMVRALKPGGLVIYEGFHPSQCGRGTGGPPDAALMVTAADLAADFAQTRIVVLEETEIEVRACTLHDGGPGAVSRMVAYRP